MNQLVSFFDTYSCYLILFIVQALVDILIVITASNTLAGSDSSIHFAIIRGLKRNQHRFLTDEKHLNFHGIGSFGYPQFYHWLMSFLPLSFLQKRYFIIRSLINSGILIAFMIFANLYYHRVNIIAFEHWNFILYSGLLFICNPFSYFGWNASITGISARPIGLFFNHLFLYSYVLYWIDHEWFYLVSVYFFSALIFMTSTLAFQFVILFSVIGFFFNGIWLLLISFAMAFLINLGFNWKASINCIKEFYWHKLFYYKHYAKNYLLKERYSVWRDLVYDLWIKVYWNPIEGTAYAMFNPVLTVVFGFPCLAALFYLFYLGKMDLPSWPLTIYSTLFLSVLIAIIIFLLTSLRCTRFLGEPERYINHVFPFIPILLLSNINFDFIWLRVVLFFSVFYSGIHFIGIRVVKKRSDFRMEILKRIVDCIDNLYDGKIVRVACNNCAFSKLMITSKHNVLRIRPTAKYAGSFLVEEITKDNLLVLPENLFIPLSREFYTDILIFDTNYYRFEDCVDQKDLSFRFLGSVDNYEIVAVLD